MESIILPGTFVRFEIKYTKSGIEYYVVCLVNLIAVQYPLTQAQFEEFSELDARSLNLDIEKQYALINERKETIKM